MNIGVPREIKNNENRVAVVPSGVETLTQAGHTVYVETGAGMGTSLTDDAYAAAGGAYRRERRRSLGRVRTSSARSKSRSRRSMTTSGPTTCCSPTSTSPPRASCPKPCSDTRRCVPGL